LKKLVFTLGLILALVPLASCNDSDVAAVSQIPTPPISAEASAPVPPHDTTISTFATPDTGTAPAEETAANPSPGTLPEVDTLTQDPPKDEQPAIVVGETLPPKPLPPFKVKETVIEFLVDGQKVVGTLAVPEGTDPAPVILLFHGYTGSRESDPVAGTNESLFGRTARLWATEGYASLRIDFRDSGVGKATWANTTFDRQIEDAVAAVEFLKSEARVDGKRIAAVGWSQGGLVTSALAAKTPGLKAAGLWNAVTVPPLTYATILGSQTLKTGLTAGNKIVGSTNLKGPFFEGIYAIDPVAEMAKYAGPLFVAIGTKDTVVAPQPQMGKLFTKYHEGIEELWIRDMDHGFNKETSAVMIDEMAKATLAFLRKGLDAQGVVPGR